MALLGTEDSLSTATVLYNCTVVNVNDQPLERLARRDPVARLPRAVAGEPGLFIVDATWGLIQPLQLPGGVPTVGELEVLEHVRAGGALIDTRQPEHVAHGTLPGAVAIRHEDIVDGLAELRPAGPVVLFCNGPQCTATPAGRRRAARRGLGCGTAALLPGRGSRLGHARPAAHTLTPAIVAPAMPSATNTTRTAKPWPSAWVETRSAKRGPSSAPATAAPPMAAATGTSR